MTEDRSQANLSQPETDVVKLFRTVVRNFSKRKGFSVGIVTTSYGRVSLSLSSGDLGISEGEPRVPEEQPVSYQDILIELKNLQEIRARADRLERENRERIIRILDVVLRDNPHREEIRSLLSP
jgi:hypothetical protein